MPVLRFHDSLCSESLMTNASKNLWEVINLPDCAADILKNCRSYIVPKTREEIFALAVGNQDHGSFEVAYDVEGRHVLEATVTKVRNGLVINYADAYMRRRDPNCMLVAGDKQTDKVKFATHLDTPFSDMRASTFEWLKKQDLSVTFFTLGGLDEKAGRGAMLIAPANAGFFVGALADLQGLIAPDKMTPDFNVYSIIYLAPTFRHTHFNGKQIVVHNRLDN
jgi:hypothetical protein